MSRTVTVAALTMRPFGSLTMTWRSPLATPWLNINCGTKANSTAKQNRRRVAFINSPGVPRKVQTGIEVRGFLPTTCTSGTLEDWITAGFYIRADTKASGKDGTPPPARVVINAVELNVFCFCETDSLD